MQAVSEYEIGNSAGKIWALLSKGDKLAVPQVLSSVEAPESIIYGHRLACKGRLSLRTLRRGGL